MWLSNNKAVCILYFTLYALSLCICYKSMKKSFAVCEKVSENARTLTLPEANKILLVAVIWTCIVYIY